MPSRWCWHLQAWQPSSASGGDLGTQTAKQPAKPQQQALARSELALHEPCAWDQVSADRVQLQVHLQWRDVTCTLTSKKKGKRALLKGLSGEAKPGRC